MADPWKSPSEDTPVPWGFRQIFTAIAGSIAILPHADLRNFASGAGILWERSLSSPIVHFVGQRFTMSALRSLLCTGKLYGAPQVSFDLPSRLAGGAARSLTRQPI